MINTYKVTSWIKPWIIYLLFKMNKLRVSILEKIKYEDLIFLSSTVFKESNDYEKLMLKIVELQEIRIKEEANKRKIKVAFLFADSSSFWAFDDVYFSLKNSIYFEPYVVVPLYRTKDKVAKRDAILYFRKKGIRHYVVKEEKDAKWEKRILPDIVVSQVPYVYSNWQKNFCVENLPCSCMTMFVPYSFWVAEKLDIGFRERGYLKKFGKIFAPSKMHMHFFKNKLGISDSRLFYSGYPKCDTYYREKNGISDERIWGGGEKVHIIYAPGLVDAEPRFSTFASNYMQMLSVAKATKDTVSWVIRLHPAMIDSCISQGVFANLEEWNSYIEKWEKLENVMVSMHEDYSDIFKTSDGMIMDSISFLPVYQYVHKPLLLLTQKTQKMNYLGSALKKVVYTVDARDIEGIKDFINNVIIDGQDYKKEMRENFFNENLDYYKENGQSASDYIVNTINSLL